jgi:hypothetical protein
LLTNKQTNKQIATGRPNNERRLVGFVRVM